MSRNLRTVWNIATQPYSGAHYATFPEALAERCILAGTSARGACPECGAGWERITDKDGEYTPVETKSDKGNDRKNGNGYYRPNSRETGGVAMNGTRWTTGWSPTCACGRADTVPCRVLDPFVGSGTTVAVARKHGRVGVGVDLSAAYLRDNALPRAEGRNTDAALATLPLFTQNLAAP